VRRTRRTIRIHQRTCAWRRCTHSRPGRRAWPIAASRARCCATRIRSSSSSSSRPRPKSTSSRTWRGNTSRRRCWYRAGNGLPGRARASSSRCTSNHHHRLPATSSGLAAAPPTPGYGRWAMGIWCITCCSRWPAAS
jgi:hypothetical protein